VTEDLAAALRPATVEEWPTLVRAMDDAFGEVPSGPFRDKPSPLAELDRSLVLPDGDRMVATGGIYSLELTVPGAVVPCAGVTWITVAPTHRRRGILTAIMRRQLTEVHEKQVEPVAALWAAEYPIYGRFGYAPASYRGNLTGTTQRMRLRSDVDLGSGRVEEVPVEKYREAAMAIHDATRRQIPGNLARDDRWWDRVLRDDPEQRNGWTARRHLLYTEADGTVTGYACFRIKSSWTEGSEPENSLAVPEIRATTPTAYAALWQLLLSIDLVRTVRAAMASADDPLRHLLADGRALKSAPVDGLWVRLVDVDRALAARRYPAPIDLVLEVRDEFCPWNAGRWRLTGHPAGAHCARTDRDPDLVLGIEDLGATYLGGTSLATLQAAGRVTEVSPGAVTLASTAFNWPVPPWCPDEF
jgi:predicted acetyltransferase